MTVAGSNRQQASARRAEAGAFGRLADLVSAGRYTAADVLELLCTEVRSAFGYERAAVLRHDAAAGTVLPVVRQHLDWPDCAVAVAKLPFVAEALARREAVASRGRGVRARVARSPCRCSSPDRCPGVRRRRRAGGRAETTRRSSCSRRSGRWRRCCSSGPTAHGDLEGDLAELQHVDRAEDRLPRHRVARAAHADRGRPRHRGDALPARRRARPRSRSLELRANALRADVAARRARAEPARPVARRGGRAAGAAAPLPAARPHRRHCCARSLPTADRRAASRCRRTGRSSPTPRRSTASSATSITNALRHGEPPVEIRALTADPFRLVVDDHGAGVDPAFVGRLFDRFSRGGARERLDGAGLGLAIARSYAYALGGDLTLRAGEARGARFELVLPGSETASEAGQRVDGGVAERTSKCTCGPDASPVEPTSADELARP